MAGIGFALRKLSRRDDLLGIVQGFTHSSLASSGPWLITILTLGGIGIVSSDFIMYQELSTFRLIIIYNFAFSLVLSGPVVNLITRCLADQIYEKDVRPATGMLLGALLLVYMSQLPIALWFYFGFVKMSTLQSSAAFVNLFLINSIWILSAFLTALKNFKAVTRSFAVGMLLALVFALELARYHGAAGLLIGFNLGLAVTSFSLLARVFAEYPYPIERLFGFLGSMKEYWTVFLTGLVYNLAIWIDKWVMWFSPESKTMPSGMFSYPDYDSAMFAAYLSIVPSLAIFVYSIETSFFEKYLRFYQDIQEHKTYRQIGKRHGAMMRDLLYSSRNFLVIQISISITVVLLAPRIFDSLGISFAQLGIFRLGVLGALFHVLFLFVSIILSYFDVRRINLLLQSVFMFLNLAFTVMTLYWGFPYYGYGYFLSALVSFCLGFLVVAYYVEDLPYQTFVRGGLVARK